MVEVIEMGVPVIAWLIFWTEIIGLAILIIIKKDNEDK